MEIQVYFQAPSRMFNKAFWAEFLRGTHWRNLHDHAEVVITSVMYKGFGNLDECECKAVNNRWSAMGSEIRKFPFQTGIGSDYVTSFTQLQRAGFFLVPDTIRSDWHNRDPFADKMNNLDWGDGDLHRPLTQHTLTRGGNGQQNGPIARFNIGIPPKSIIRVKGLILGPIEKFEYCYNPLNP